MLSTVSMDQHKMKRKKKNFCSHEDILYTFVTLFSVLTWYLNRRERENREPEVNWCIFIYTATIEERMLFNNVLTSVLKSIKNKTV